MPVLFFAVPFLVSAALTYLLIHQSWRLGLMDQPDPRKVHLRPTPRSGGLAMALGTAAGVALLAWLTPDFSLLDPRWLLGPIIVVLGLVDDRRPLSWQLRLTIQAVVSALAIFLCLPTPATDLPVLVVQVLAVFWVVGLINAMNMLDNMDLLSGGTAWIICGGLTLLAWLEGTDGSASLVLMGALTGFLCFNWPPARIFMGDAGSTFLGYFLAIATLQLVFAPGAAWRWGTPLCLLAVPLYDLVRVVILRWRQGRSPFHPDKQHLSHRLVAAGFRSLVAVRLIHGLAIASVLSGILLQRMPTLELALLVGMSVICWGTLVWRIDGEWIRIRFLASSETPSAPAQRTSAEDRD